MHRINPQPDSRRLATRGRRGRPRLRPPAQACGPAIASRIPNASVVAVESYVDRLADDDGDDIPIVVVARHYGLGQRLWVSNVGDGARIINGVAADSVNDHVVAVGLQLSNSVL